MFLICSDDIKWSKENLANLPGKQSGIAFMSDRTKDYMIDFGILINSNHSIITAGTFGWWAGWLAGGEVIYSTAFNDWKLRDHPHGYNKQDFFPENWIAIG